MTSAHGVVLALVLAAGLVGVARAQARWPAGPPPTWPPDVVQAPSPAPPTTVWQECVAEYAALRSRVERTGMAVKGGAESRLGREEMCKLMTALASAETKWVTFSVGNMSSCGIPCATVDQLKVRYAKTADALRRMCGVDLGPTGPYRWDPPKGPKDYKFLPRFSGR